MSINIYFNGVKIPDWIKVKSIEQDILASLESNKSKSTFKQKTIKINFIVRQKGMWEQKKIDELVKWIKGNDFNESKLILPNAIDSYYLAKLNSNITTIKDSVYTGKGDIEFICYSPNRIEHIENTVYIKNNNTIEYIGSADSYPVIRFEVTSQCEELKLTFSNSKYKNYIRLKNSFNAGQIIKVDMKTKKVTVNDTANMKILTLDSRFHKLSEGINTYTLNVGNANVNVIYHNEYL